MSSISSGLDPAVKYQRLSAEYVKVRNQVSVLKTALVEEQSNSDELRRELNVRDTRLRKAESERDSLTFRNDQLVKRIESLQESLDAQMAAFNGTGKGGRKKHKEANLRLVAESARMHNQALGGTVGGSAPSDPHMVVEEELERKILENGELHSKIFDLEKRFDEVTAEFIQRIDDLQRENGALRSSQAASAHQVDSIKNGPIPSAPQPTDEDAKNAENSLELNLTVNNNAASPVGKSGTSDSVMPYQFSPSNSAALDTSTSQQNVTTTLSSRSSEGKPSDSAISLDSVEPDSSDEMTAMKRRILEDYFTERIATLTKSLQHATGRAFYYKQECEELIRRNLAEHKEMANMQKKIRDLEDKCAMLYETLETTQQNYEEQMRQLYEHMANS